MSGSITSSSSAPAASGTSAGSVSNSASSDPLGSLTSNFDSFLQLLMTQLQNQDPSSPMDTDQFTSELVQFSSVEQQIDTNQSLQQLIQLTQAGEVVQSTGMLGHQVVVQSNTLALQQGQATVQFTATAPGPTDIVVSDSSGNQLYATQVNASTGSNSWTWNGQDASGNQLADGGYNVTVTQNGVDGSGTTLPVDVVGQVTGVQDQSSGVQLQLGSVPVSFANIRAVLD
jgi:flagellar basal-body rod modification protein FlgD